MPVNQKKQLMIKTKILPLFEKCNLYESVENNIFYEKYGLDKKIKLFIDYNITKDIIISLTSEHFFEKSKIKNFLKNLKVCELSGLNMLIVLSIHIYTVKINDENCGKILIKILPSLFTLIVHANC